MFIVNFARYLVFRCGSVILIGFSIFLFMNLRPCHFYNVRATHDVCNMWNVNCLRAIFYEQENSVMTCIHLIYDVYLFNILCKGFHLRSSFVSIFVQDVDMSVKYLLLDSKFSFLYLGYNMLDWISIYLELRCKFRLPGTLCSKGGKICICRLLAQSSHTYRKYFP